MAAIMACIMSSMMAGAAANHFMGVEQIRLPGNLKIALEGRSYDTHIRYAHIESYQYMTNYSNQ